MGASASSALSFDPVVNRFGLILTTKDLDAEGFATTLRQVGAYGRGGGRVYMVGAVGFRAGRYLARFLRWPAPSIRLELYLGAAASRARPALERVAGLETISRA